MNIPFLNLEYAHQQIENKLTIAFQSVLKSNRFILGKNLEIFESDYAAFNKVRYAIGVSNGLDALHLALMSLGLASGDEVIVASNTFIATLFAISEVGAKPVLVEPDYKTYNINPENIEKAITPKTKAIIPVHLYGQACEMESITAIAQRHRLFIVEDNAQAQGAFFKGKLTGSWGQVNTTSFYPGKNLGALGDGGAVTTDNEEIEKKIRLFRNYGSDVKYHHDVMGFNMRLDEMQAAFLSIKLNYLNEWNRQRQEIANWYSEALEGTADIILPVTHPQASHVYHLYVIRSSYRDALQQHLAAHGIGTLIHYPIPPHLQKAYNSLNHVKGDFPIAEELANTCLSLPLWPGMTRDNVAEVVKCIKKFNAFNRH